MNVHNIIRPFLWLVLVLWFGGITAQDSLMTDFPQKWVGNWSGELEIYAAKGKVQTLPMELHILPADSAGVWKWTIIYQVEKPDVREYEMVLVDREKGHFLIDEKNSIKLDAWLLGNVLSCRFSVDNSLLLVNYTFESEHIRFEVFAGSKAHPQLTGEDAEDVNEILNYPVTNMQRAILRK